MEVGFELRTSCLSFKVELTGLGIIVVASKSKYTWWLVLYGCVAGVAGVAWHVAEVACEAPVVWLVWLEGLVWLVWLGDG